MICKWCGKEYEKPKYGMAKFIKRTHRPKGGCCSGRCYNGFHSNRRRIKGECTQCGSPVTIRSDRKTTLCSACYQKSVNPLIGELNGNWKGGHRNWSPGRFGKDKDGLSWRKQRKLAFELDGGKCQDPECTTPHMRICVHHISPYRVSLSHALDNLICYCDRCHGKHDAMIQEHWGRHQVVQLPKPVLPKCKRCNRVLCKSFEGYCFACVWPSRMDSVINMRNNGITMQTIADSYNCSIGTVYEQFAKLVKNHIPPCRERRKNNQTHLHFLAHV